MHHLHLTSAKVFSLLCVLNVDLIDELGCRQARRVSRCTFLPESRKLLNKPTMLLGMLLFFDCWGVFQKLG